MFLVALVSLPVRTLSLREEGGRDFHCPLLIASLRYSLLGNVVGHCYNEKNRFIWSQCLIVILFSLLVQFILIWIRRLYKEWSDSTIRYNLMLNSIVYCTCTMNMILIFKIIFSIISNIYIFLIFSRYMSIVGPALYGSLIYVTY